MFSRDASCIAGSLTSLSVRQWAAMIAATLLLAGTSAAFAQIGPAMYQDGVTPMPMQPTGTGQVSVYAEYGNKIRASEQQSALGGDLFGESISPQSGATEFSVVDIDIPGNSALPVQLRRRLVVSSLAPDQIHDANGGMGNPYGGLGNWDIDVPHIYGTFDAAYGWENSTNPATPQPRCSNYFIPLVSNPNLSANDIWSGTKVHIPGEGDKELLRLSSSYPPLQYPSDGRAPTWTTSAFDAFTCTAPSTSAHGEGFVMTTAQGITYTFDVYLQRAYAPVKAPGGRQNARKMIFLLASQVRDRHGNTVTYQYNGLGHPTLIQSSAPDTRTITLTYNGSQLANASVTLSAPVQTRTWTYGYTTPTAGPSRGITRLTSVSLPDGLSQWLYDYTTLTPGDTYLFADFVVPDIVTNCAIPAPNVEPFGLRITHPAGARGEFEFSMTPLGRSNMPPSNCSNGIYKVAPSTYAFRLTSKALYHADANNDAARSVWTYGYSSTSCANCTRTTITQPDDSVVQQEFSSVYGAALTGAPAGSAIEGSLLKTLTKASSLAAPLRTVTNTYISGVDTIGAPLSGHSFPSRYGLTSGGDDPSSGSLRPLRSTTMTQDGVDFITTHETFDALGRPIEITRSSTPGQVKEETTAYVDCRGNLAAPCTATWLLSLVDTITDTTVPATPVVAVDHDYDSIGNRTRESAFGLMQREMTYNADGTLASVTDAAGIAHTTVLGPFKRGSPTSVTHPGPGPVLDRTESATIDDVGMIRAVTDENGYTTTYGYDALDRLTSIAYPGSDAVVWNATTILYEQVGGDMGIVGTHWRQTRTTGMAKTVTHYDQRLRPVLTVEWDTVSPGTTRRAIERRFDHDNREVFASYPQRTIASIGAPGVLGTATEYDALGRVAFVRQDSELGVLTTGTTYTAPFTKSVTNPRGYTTRTTFQTFDRPDESAPLVMTQLGSVATDDITTTVVRDRFGKPTSLTRSGTYLGQPVSAVRNYVYDTNHRLCKTIEPESGATVVDYDNANQIAWKASGQNLTSTSNCQQTSVLASQKVSYTYDARNRPDTTSFGDGSPSVSRAYTLDGLPYTITSNNSTWTLLYNKRRLLRNETLSLDSTNYAIEYTHSPNGHVASVRYPDSTVVAYAPNALGEVTQVGDYASQITMHPNGALSGFTYGNGVVHTTEQNDRGLPSRSTDGTFLNDVYTYDANANVARITDQSTNARSFTRDMQYDTFDRLTQASNGGVWGGAMAFTYDPLDNLRTSATPSVNLRHEYDATTQRLTRIALANDNTTAIAYSYDTRGRATQRNAQTFTLDLADRVRQATPYNGDVVAYRYDGNGRRMATTKRLAASESPKTTVQVYTQAGQLLYQVAPINDGIFKSGFQGSDASYPPGTGGIKRYVYLGRHLIAEDGTGGRSYVHTDGLGTPIIESTRTAGIGSRVEYTPYGYRDASWRESEPGFTGHVTDAETTLSYMQARYYDPYAGRFLSLDPVQAASGSVNRYWYANNNPYKFVDLDGRRACGKDTTCRLEQGERGGSSLTIYGAQVENRSSLRFNVPEKYRPQLPEQMLGKVYDDLIGRVGKGKEEGDVGIRRADGGYNSTSMPPKAAGEIDWTFKKGDDLAYLSHTHGFAINFYENLFSTKDTTIANTYRVPVFLIDKDSNFRVYLPGMPAGTRFGSRKLNPGQAEGVLLCNNPCK